VVVIGNPFGLEGSVTNGIVSAVRDIPTFGRIIQITAPISPGSRPPNVSRDARPEARRYLEQLPARWEETRLLTGDPGRSAVLAREAPDGRWFIGGTFAGAAQTVKVPLRLGSGRWLVETVTDGASGLVREPHVVRGGDSLDVPVLTDGGFAALACRWQPGRTTCDR